MQLEHILSRDCTKSAVPCTSKKRALEIISELAAERLGTSRQVLFECLLAREKWAVPGSVPVSPFPTAGSATSFRRPPS